LPPGADCVIMVEDVDLLLDTEVRFKTGPASKNICFRGEDIGQGNMLIPEGVLVEPQHIAVMAAVGATNPEVYCQAKAAVISTGDELVEPDQQPGSSMIRNSNAYQLLAQVRKAGAIAKYFGIARDTEVSLREKILSAIDISDIVILTGGVSMGDYDYVPAVLRDCGFDLLFEKIAVQPGKPTLFGKKGNGFVFGLPGNPVSSFVLFEILVKPFLRKVMGSSQEVPAIKLPMGTDFNRKKSARKSFIPVKILEGQLFPLDYHGSAHINAYTEANGIIAMEIGKTILRKGDLLDVRQI
jgi:molybdopterin molybdotransferase